MKRVKFNGSTNYSPIPDEALKGYQDYVKDLQKGDFSKQQQLVSLIQSGGAASRWGFITVKGGDVKDVPNWYYNDYKDSDIILPVSSDTYTTRDGKLSPFDMKEHIRHGHVKTDNTIQVVKLFELVEDLDETEEKAVPKSQNNKK